MKIEIFISDQLMKIKDDNVVNRAIDVELEAVKRLILKSRSEGATEST